MDTVFHGGVFCEAISGGRSGANIELTGSGVVAHLPTGESFTVPYRECQLEMGGHNGKMVFCRTPDNQITIFSEDKQFLKELTVASSGMLDDQLETTRRKQKGTARRDRFILACVLFGFVLALVLGYLGVRRGAAAAAKTLPVSVDKQIGDAAFESMDLGGPEIENAVVLGAIRKMVARLEPHASRQDMDFDVHVVDSPTVNAFCLPGGKIVVFSGLINQADSAEQVAAVISHEMAHATLRHGVQRVGQSLGVYAAITLLIGDAQGLLAAGAELFQTATINSYSRDHENEADEEGVRMMHAAGIDPEAMAEFFAILEKEHGDLPGMMSWISTHPDHASRIDHVRSFAKDLPKTKYTHLEIDWAAVQAQTR